MMGILPFVQNIYDDDPEYVTAQVNVGVCSGRHEMPVDNFIFNNEIEDPTNVEALEAKVSEWIDNVLCPIIHVSNAYYATHVCVYVTGLTVATGAIISTLLKRRNSLKRGVNLSLYHYDAKRGTYYRQDIF